MILFPTSKLVYSVLLHHQSVSKVFGYFGGIPLEVISCAISPNCALSFYLKRSDKLPIIVQFIYRLIFNSLFC